MLRKDDVRTKLWKKLKKSNINVYIVDGESVRNQHDVDFSEGGHGYVYDYIPKNEIWIDNDISIKERSKILAHEFIERGLMKDKGFDYETAHKKATKIESALRKKDI